MRRWPSVLACAAVALTCLGSVARATPINYSYVGNPSFQVVSPPTITQAGVGVQFITQPPASATANLTNGLVTNLYATPSSASATDTYTNVFYNTGVTVTDTASSLTHTFSFSGLINGTVSDAHSSLTNTFSGSTTQSFVIGSTNYTVTINPVTMPGVGAPGSINYSIAVGNGNGVNKTPEPSTLMLSGLGLSFLGLFSWRRRLSMQAV